MVVTVILFTITTAIFYVWLKRKKYESVIMTDVDLEEPLNGSNGSNGSNGNVSNTFYSLFNNNGKVQRATDTFLPNFLQDNTDYCTESYPVPYKFTETGNAGFFVYKEDNLNPSKNKTIDNHKINITSSLNSLRSTNYHSPTNSFINEESNKDYYYNEVL